MLVKKNYYLILLLLFISTWTNLVLAQGNFQIKRLYQIAEQLLYSNEPTKESYEQALQAYQKIIEICNGESLLNDTLANAYLNVGSILFGFEQYEESLLNYHLSLKSLQALKPSEDSVFFKNYVYIGDVHNKLDNFDSSEYYYYKAQNIALRWQENISEIERLYNSLGFMYYALGNYKQAYTFLQKALSIVEKRFPDDLESQVYFKNNLAAASSKSNNYDEAISEYQDLLRYGFVSYSLYNNLGRMYGKKGNLDSAAYYLKKAVNTPNNHTKITALNNLGNTYSESGSLDTALLYYQQALTLNQQTFSSKNTELAETYSGIAQVQEKQNNWQEALANYQKSMISLVYGFEDSSVYANPAAFGNTISLLHLFEVLKGKAQTFYQYYRQDQDTAKLAHSLACYQEAIRLAKHIQKSYDSDDAKLFFVEHIYPVFEEALAPVYALYELTGDPQYVKMGLAMAEASKASVLSETLKDVEIKTGGVVNDSLVKDEKRLKQKITSLRIRLAQSNDAAQNLTYQESLTDLEIALARTIKTLQKDEKYYQLKYQEDSLDLTAIQRQAVGDGAVALEYVTCQDFIYIFLITDQKTDLKRVRLTPAFDESLKQVQNQLYDYQAGRRDEGQQSTAQLYRFLIEPYEADIRSANRLIIIPDGRLSYIPFEILSAEATPRRYLIQDYTCNYAYSATLLLDAIRHRKGELENTVLAMAPFAGKDRGNIRSKGFNLLAASRQEVEQIGGSIYLENRATKRLFLKMAGSYGILHLATHASVNSENPLQSYIAFYPDQGESDAGYRLYTQELYNLKLDHVKLVVLSACEAGSGQVVQGEGVISLARAFAYAGCPNIVTTLWKADDRSAAEITTRMHRYLKSGYAKDKALRLAKLDYLNSDIHPILKSPYYWANFIFIGDPAPIYSSYTFIWYMLAGVLAAALLVYGIRRYVRVRTGQVA